jgi:hypothetical protein
VAGAALVLTDPDPGGGDGDGDGGGGGYGYGYGGGGGDGDGDGGGYGYGDGYGDGGGYGYGDGGGGGYGYGYGGGGGDGDGYGDGYGDGGGYWTAALQPYLTHPAVHAATADGTTITLAWWRSDRNGHSANGGKGRISPAQPGTTHEIPGPLELCTSRALHASIRPGEWKGDRWWIVALHHPIATDDGGKAGSLKRTIIAELGPGT